MELAEVKMKNPDSLPGLMCLKRRLGKHFGWLVLQQCQQSRNFFTHLASINNHIDSAFLNDEF
jgi:hypothetical protein